MKASCKRMTVFHRLIYVLSQSPITEVYIRCDHAACTHFAAAIDCRNKDFHKNASRHTKRIVAATCRLVCPELHKYISFLYNYSYSACDT